MQRKAAKNFSLISFGDEAEAEEEAAVEAAASLKIASAHDALHDAHLSKEAALDVDLNRRVAGCGCGRFQLLWLVVAAVAGGRSETLWLVHGSELSAMAVPPSRPASHQQCTQSLTCSVREALRSARQRQEEEAPPSTSAAPAPQPSDLESRMRERVQARRAAKASEGEGRPGQNQSPSGSGGEEDEEDGDASEEDGRPRRRAARSLAGTGQGKRSTAAVVVPSRQIAVADANLLSSWEKRRKVGGVAGGEGARVRVVQPPGEQAEHGSQVSLMEGGLLEAACGVALCSLCGPPRLHPHTQPSHSPATGVPGAEKNRRQPAEGHAEQVAALHVQPPVSCRARLQRRSRGRAQHRWSRSRRARPRRRSCGSTGLSGPQRSARGRHARPRLPRFDLDHSGIMPPGSSGCQMQAFRGSRATRAMR